MKRRLPLLALLTIYLLSPLPGEEHARLTLDDGLVAYWPLDGNFRDALGTFHGERRGAPAAFVSRDGFGRALLLDGKSSVEIVGGDENILDFKDGSMSLSVWFTLEEGNEGQILMGKSTGNTWQVYESTKEERKVFFRSGDQSVRDSGVGTGNASPPGGDSECRGWKIRPIP